MSLVGPTITCAPGVFMYLVSLKTQHHTGTTGQECIGISNLDWSPVLAQVVMQIQNNQDVINLIQEQQYNSHPKTYHTQIFENSTARQLCLVELAPPHLLLL